MAIMQSCCCWRSVRRGSFACAIYSGIYFGLLALTTGNLLQGESQYLKGNRSLPESTSFLESDTISPRSTCLPRALDRHRHHDLLSRRGTFPVSLHRSCSSSEVREPADNHDRHVLLELPTSRDHHRDQGDRNADPESNSGSEHTFLGEKSCSSTSETRPVPRHGTRLPEEEM